MFDTGSSDQTEFDDRVINSAALLGTAPDVAGLREIAERLISLYLQHPKDAEVLAQTLTQVRAFFSSKMPIDALRQFSVQVIRVILSSRPAEYYDDMLYQDQNAGDSPSLDGNIHHAPTDVIIPPAPQPVICQTFEELATEALCYKIRVITGFFQRRNPLIMRGVKVPYLLSAAFEERMCTVVRQIIAPMIFRQKKLGAMVTAHPWRTISSAAFWTKLEVREEAIKVVKAWESVWLTLYQSERHHHHPPDVKLSAAEERAITRNQQTLLEIQHMLSGPEYAMPKLSLAQLKVFQTFLTNFDRTVMEQVWKGLRQTYEQELDRRPYQEKARHGALRDSFLAAFDLCTPNIGEILVVLSYYAFPKLSLHWLKMFSFNMGGSHEERIQKIPVLTRFLEQDDAVRAYDREPARVLLDLEASAVIAA